MTHIPEVLEVMEGGDNTTSKKTEKVLRVPYILAFPISVIFLLSLLVSSIFLFKYFSCYESLVQSRLDANEIGIESFNEFFTAKPTKNLRLSRSVVPDTYKLKIIPFIWEGNFTFHGEVSIVVNVTQPTDKITLHSLNLNASEWHVYKLRSSTNSYGDRGEDEVEVFGTSYDVEKQFFILHLSDSLKRGSQYRVFIRYAGHINNDLQGFYRSSYKMGNETRWIAVTQFQPTDARQAFPCFDEPSFKAKFTLSIARLFNMSTLSNMPIEEYAVKTDDLPPEFVIDKYKESLPMSTYLVAFAITDFYQLSENRFHVWARKEAIDQARYALSLGSKILQFYERFFRIHFPLPKMDMIALPDFGSGAMENWGLITFRETTMLYKEGVSTRFNKGSVATIVAHELAHQWFGNLVTPEWWSDLWLNEGFANYMEYLAIEAVEPSWKIQDQFVVDELQIVLSLDALISSHPISVEVSDPNEINEIFDSISYSKGASVIRMMDHFLTRTVFIQGLTNYLTKRYRQQECVQHIIRAYQCATQNDLWEALTEEAHRQQALPRNMSVKEIMDTWTLQTGFPVINVERNYRNNLITVTQSRFFVNNESNSNEDRSKWWVPLTYTTELERDFKNTKPSYWLRAEDKRVIDNITASETNWIIFNIQQTGYYRVNYDEKNWRLLTETLNDEKKYQTIDAVNRAQLINDAMKLAHAGHLKYSIALDLSLYLHYELEYIPWSAGLNAFEYLNDMFLKSANYDKFKVYMSFLVSKLYEKTGFFEQQGDDQLDIYKRVEVVSHACRLGFEDCIRNSVHQFQSWRFSSQPDINNPISTNLKSTVYCTAIRVGSQREWEFAWQRYLKSNVGSEKDLLLGALGCTRETWILSRYLDWALNETSGIRKQDVVRVFSAVSNNVIGQPLAWSVLRDQWDRVVKYLGTSLFGLSNIVKSVLHGINTEHEINEVINFALKHKNETGQANRAFLQSIGRARTNQVWMEKNYNTIVAWLEKTVPRLPLKVNDNLI